jgi:DNA helicase-2/ATP-dependent DNA helicase PcrA
MGIDLEKLNENQSKAVLWEDGPLLVLAGPGSGKTRVLTYRVARLLQDREDVSVLALTFTNKAAAEMRERVNQLLGQRGDRAHLCTFHSFAVDILRQHGSHLGLQPDFSLVTLDEDRIAILTDPPDQTGSEPSIVRKLSDEGHLLPTDHKNLLSLLDRLFAESYDGGPEAPSLVNTPAWLPQLFASYCEALVAANRLDFGSLLHFARRLLQEKAGVARVLRLGWSHICVDEFQDTNKAQFDLLRLIAPEKQHNLFVVGDDDQIIYQWNGASPERLQALQREYDMEVIQLPECYRCPAEIITLANRLIKHNLGRTPDKTPIRARRTASLEDGVIRHRAFDTPDDEVSFLSRDIRKRGLDASDCVVLGRATKLLERAASSLIDAGFEAYVARRKSDFEAPVVQVMFNALRLANARHDRDILRRLCLAWDALTDQFLEVEDVAADAALSGGDFLRAWADAASADAVGPEAKAVGRIRSDLVDRLSFPDTVDWFLAEGWKQWSEDNDQDLKEEIATWKELHDGLVCEYGHDDLTLNAYIQQMDLTSKATRPGPNAVRCMTVHGSKGLEFKHVYLIGMAQEVLPSFQALRKGVHSREFEEERRNCFVAITRVQETLTLTLAREYYGYSKKPSQFLAEMGIGVGG